MGARSRGGGCRPLLPLSAALLLLITAPLLPQLTRAQRVFPVRLTRVPFLVAPGAATARASSVAFARGLLQATDGGTDGGSTNASAPAGGVVTAGADLPGDVVAVRSCLPFNVLVLPGSESGSGPNGSILMSAEDAVLGATDISYAPDTGILALSLSKGYESTRVINLTITAANTSSLRYVQNFGPGNVVVGPGFNVSDFNAAATSIGGVLATGLTARRVFVTNTGTGTVALNGTFSNGGEVLAGGTGKVYLSGRVGGNVAVSVDGISATWIQGTPDTTITGTANSLAKVLYTAGQCSVKAAFQSLFGVNIFGDPCQRATPGSGPSYSPAWSCGQRVNGQSMCPADTPLPGSSGVGLSGSAGVQGASDEGSGPQTEVIGGGNTGGNMGGAAAQGAPDNGGTASVQSGGMGATPNVNTVSGQPGTVMTGTFTTPGGRASASGSVSGPSGSLGAQQTSAEGAPPVFQSGGGILGQTSGLDPDFQGLLNSLGGGGGSSSSAQASSVSGGGGATTASTSGGPSSSSSQTSQSSSLNIPTISSGLSVSSLTCDDPASARAMFAPPVATTAGAKTAAGAGGRR
ncbi:hypothetical protein HYH03_010254 [Edaphochlamys debaryana]|uniref:Auto-transporter adhesin head GIN domain-containing protein n=1 Tax=Edaphochlamys debaryana TaxID=47281 RepID=A0A836BXR2_9CHLO|nr:hypothetical protein HYH03_010254 [Edaphochlamys debaryana]|eukprot:KAG2491469.1 hypothetical protein HYH03_010254 [Edaphochlamys debaryana]